jgi:MOSC domain-containing protein YiiM
MFEGRLDSIWITDRKATPLHSVDQAEAVAGHGLVADRYHRQEGTFSKPSPDREITLIEREALEALGRDCQIALEPGQARRNLVTRGVPLNHLVGREFLVGDVLLRGIRLCEPCGHLERLTVLGVEKGLLHRGGLRAQIVRGGTLKCGDVVRAAEEAR